MIYGFSNGGLKGCSEDTRYMSDKELIKKLNDSLDFLKTRKDKLKQDMIVFAKLSKDYFYDQDIRGMVGRCFIELDIVNQDIKEVKDKIKKINK